MKEKMKEKIYILSKVFIAFSLFCLGVLQLDNKIYVSAATDYSSQVVIDDWDILDIDGNPLTEVNGATPNGRYQFEITWSLASVGDVIHAGDTLTVPTPRNLQIGSWGKSDSAYVDFTGADGTVIGQWKFDNGKISVVFGENAEGLSAVTATFLSGSGALTNIIAIGTELIQDVSVGNVTKQILFYSTSLLPMGSTDTKGAGSASNSQIGWYVYTNSAGPIELAQQEWGANFTIKSDAYAEDIIEEGASTLKVSFMTKLPIPIDLEAGTPSRTTTPSISLQKFFTEVEQNSTETYIQFKARLNAFEYGIYTDSFGIETFVVNYGDIGNNGLKYSEASPNFAINAANSAISQGFYTEEDRANLEAYYEKVYGDSNVINGDIAWFQTNIYVEYDKILNDTKKTNTIDITMNGEIKSYTGTGTLQGNLGTTSVASSAAGLYLYDEETEVLLEGATFKLQYNNNGVWEDYSAVNTLTTDEEGFLQTPTLGSGNYRFVQLTASDEFYNLADSHGYDSSIGNVVSAEFTINPLESEGELVEVSNIKYRYDIVYQSGEYGVFEDNEHLEVVALSATPAYSGEICNEGTPLGEEGYEFAGWDKEVSPVVVGSVVYVAQWREANVEDYASDQINNPTQTNSQEIPNGGLEQNPFGILAVIIVGGFSLVFKLKK